MPTDTGLQDQIQTSNDFEVLTFYNGEIHLQYDAALHAYFVEDDGIRVLVPGATTVCGMIDKSGPLTQWAANSAVQLIRDKLIVELPGGKLSINTSLIQDPGNFQQLMDEARFNFRKISKTALDIGTLAHNWIERRLQARIMKVEIDNPYPENEKAKNCIDAYLKWEKEVDFVPVASEFKVLSRDNMFSGTGDIRGYATYDGKRLYLLGDFKSSKAIYEEYRAQTAAYQVAYQEEHPNDPLDGRILIRLGKEDGEFETLLLNNGELEFDFGGFLGMLAAYNWTKQLETDRKVEKLALKLAKKAEKALTKKVKKVTVKEVQTVQPIAA